jgi:predicted metal-dependent phosphoesterase TrpH
MKTTDTDYALRSSIENNAGGVVPPLVDLHLHTTASDGQLSPTELIEQVAGTSLRIVAVTDHDSTEGMAEARDATARHPHLTLISGIELGTEDGESDVHLVGHFVDPGAPGLQDYLSHLRDGRIEAAQGTVIRLGELGIHISWERVMEIAGGSVGRPHIARAMAESGYVANAQDAFQRYLGSDGIARVKRPKPTPGDGVRFLHSIGATATLAHPQTVKHLGRILGFLVDEGLDGIEVFAPKYGSSDRERRLEVAKRSALIAVGGSDYHAWGTSEEIIPGDAKTVGPPTDAVDKLRSAADRWQAAAAKAPQIPGEGHPTPNSG